jgi:galactoside O-acetyltransferase
VNVTMSDAMDMMFSLLARLRLGRCGEHVRLKASTVIRGREHIFIGKNFSSMGSLYLYANDGGYLEVGDNCSVNTNVQLGAAGGRLVIGDDVLIGPNVVIRVANHGTRREPRMKYQPHVYGEIVIGDDVWIGSNAVIAPGVAVAVGTVVGAGAVVTSSTEPYSIVAGVPARKIGERA